MLFINRCGNIRKKYYIEKLIKIPVGNNIIYSHVVVT